MDRTLDLTPNPSGRAEPLPGPSTRPLTDIDIPVRNEEVQLEPSVARAVLAIPVGLWLYRRAGRTHPAVGGYLLWGSWLAVTALTFSFMPGIIHEYYTVARVVGPPARHPPG